MATDGAVNKHNSVAYTAQQERRLATSRLMPGPASEPFSGRSGRPVNGAGLAVSVDSTGAGTYTVTAGAGVIYDSAYATQGAWEFEIDNAIGPVSFPARPGAGTTRIDLIIARIYDQDISVGAVREVKVERVAGTASSSPATPALPVLSLRLATVTVPSSGSITVTANPAVTTAAGGVLPVATTTERDALVAAGIAYPGFAVFNNQTGALEVNTGGSVWGKVTAGDTGWSTLPLASGYTTNDGVVPAIRLLSGVVYYKGTVKPTSGSFATSASTTVVGAGGIPSAMRPAADTLFPVVGNSVATPVIRAQVGADGSLAIISGSSAQAYAGLASIAYPL